MALLAVRAKENNRWWPKDPEALQEFLVQIIVCGNVSLQQYSVCQCRLHTRVGEGVFLHLDAGHAPVGVEVEHRSFACGSCCCNFTVEVANGFDALKLKVRFFSDHYAAAKADRGQGLQRIAAAS